MKPLGCFLWRHFFNILLLNVSFGSRTRDRREFYPGSYGGQNGNNGFTQNQLMQNRVMQNQFSQMQSTGQQMFASPGMRMGQGQAQGQMLGGNVRNTVKMGEKRVDCDDGETGLEMDWDGSPVNYTCYSPTTPILPNPKLKHSKTCEVLASDYFPQHFCMTTEIHYPEAVPRYGNHRPIWPVFGEYKFVPAQRWLHNIEHGAVVMLYHPCAHHSLVEKLRKLVTGCLRKHIISSSNLVSEERPLVLVAWGCRLEMAWVDTVEVTEFIRSKALKGPEGTYPKEGQYTVGLLKAAEIPEGSTIEDSVICPNNI